MVSFRCPFTFKQTGGSDFHLKNNQLVVQDNPHHPFQGYPSICAMILRGPKLLHECPVAMRKKGILLWLVDFKGEPFPFKKKGREGVAGQQRLQTTTHKLEIKKNGKYGTFLGELVVSSLEKCASSVVLNSLQNEEGHIRNTHPPGCFPLAKCTKARTATHTQDQNSSWGPCGAPVCQGESGGSSSWSPPPAPPRKQKHAVIHGYAGNGGWRPVSPKSSPKKAYITQIV